MERDPSLETRIFYCVNPPDFLLPMPLMRVHSVMPINLLRLAVKGSCRTFIAETSRRKNVPELLYRLQVGADLIFTGQVNATIATQPLHTDYERATYTWVVLGTPSARFGRFGVFYEPQFFARFHKESYESSD